MSQWLVSAAGQPVTVRGPFGECFYFEQEPERPLLLAGTGTGLAPLLGVARAARAAGHRAPIHLYHGSPSPEGLYLWAELAQLAQQTPLLHVFGSVLSGASDALAARDSERCRVLGETLDRALVTGPTRSGGLSRLPVWAARVRTAPEEAAVSRGDAARAHPLRSVRDPCRAHLIPLWIPRSIKEPPRRR